MSELAKKLKYARNTASEIIEGLRLIGLRSVVIGSVADKGFSKHDVDILVLSPIKSELTIPLIAKFLYQGRPLPNKAKVTKPWRGIYFHDSRFGDVDLFFLDKLFQLVAGEPEADEEWRIK